jgi:hypothetical protein
MISEIKNCNILHIRYICECSVKRVKQKIFLSEASFTY